MKKTIILLLITLSIMPLAACNKNYTIKSESIGIEINVPDSSWNILTDNNNSFIISDNKDMISYSKTYLPENYKIPKTKEELISSLDESVSSLSEISDFNYDENNNSLFYKETITSDNYTTTLIHYDVISGEQLISTVATLTNADKNRISEIEKSIISLMK